MNSGIIIILGGAGFCPSTVAMENHPFFIGDTSWFKGSIFQPAMLVCQSVNVMESHQQHMYTFMGWNRLSSEMVPKHSTTSGLTWNTFRKRYGSWNEQECNETSQENSPVVAIWTSPHYIVVPMSMYIFWVAHIYIYIYIYVYIYTYKYIYIHIFINLFEFIIFLTEKRKDLRPCFTKMVAHLA